MAGAVKWPLLVPLRPGCFVAADLTKAAVRCTMPLACVQQPPSALCRLVSLETHALLVEEWHFVLSRLAPLANPQLPKIYQEFLRTWRHPALVMFSDKCPITRDQAGFFQHLLPLSGTAPGETPPVCLRELSLPVITGLCCLVSTSNMLFISNNRSPSRVLAISCRKTKEKRLPRRSPFSSIRRHCVSRGCACFPRALRTLYDILCADDSYPAFHPACTSLFLHKFN